MTHVPPGSSQCFASCAACVGNRNSTKPQERYHLMSDTMVIDRELQKALDQSVVIRRLQLLRRASDRGETTNTGRRFTDTHKITYLGRIFISSLRAMPWFEVWALGIHSTLLMLHAIVVTFTFFH